ncbi:hypothetical protein [Photorhabdus sp. RM71S]|uniref:hypothetical protein n=1 Tax=Photorhabdus sp. RM71S TaxID=3342824 RepID=UPI0036DAD4E1
MKKTEKEQSENQNTIPTVNKIKDDSYVDGKDSYKKQTSMLETAHYTISLSKDTNNQPADGKSLNQATATLLRNDSPYAGQVVFALTGSAYFDDGSQNKTLETNSEEGKTTVNFYDKKPEGETVTLSVAYPNDIIPDATDEKRFSFTPFKPEDFSISLTKDTDNQPADGKSLNQATAALLRNDSPYAGQVVFTLTDSAYFDDGSQNKTIETNSKDGKATVSFYDTKKEGETVTLSVEYIGSQNSSDAHDSTPFSFTPPFVDPNSILIFKNVPDSMTTDGNSFHDISVSVIDKNYLPCTIQIQVKTNSDKLHVTPEYVTLNDPGTFKTVQLSTSPYTVESPTNIGHPHFHGEHDIISASIVNNPSVEIQKEIEVRYVVHGYYI